MTPDEAFFALIATTVLIPFLLMAYRVWRKAYRSAERDGAIHVDRETRP